MAITSAFKNFSNQLEQLKKTISDCDDILISDSPFAFVYDNANFLTKSFLIALCGYLESYQKDLLEILILDYRERLKNESFPYNLIRWSIEQKSTSSSKVKNLLENKNMRNENVDIKLKKKDLDSFISGNPFRTKELFNMFGIDLESIDYFNINKDLVNSIVVKRNNILHHNDDASDLSNQDVMQYVVIIGEYAEHLDATVSSSGCAGQIEPCAPDESEQCKRVA